ncbi:MAG: molybdopterin molybdotransferase MoeA [Anaerovoracaceae bacterium]|jgi:molybdopterin molybdotransferase
MFTDHISKEEALARIRAAWQPQIKNEEVPLAEAAGRVCAEDCRARVSLPVVRAAGMDGICVNFDLLADGIPDTSAWRRGRDYDRADTGDDFDDRFDTVLPIEWIRSREDGGIDIDMPAGRPGGGPKLHRGMNVQPAGGMLEQGTLLVHGGTALTPLDLAALAAGGYGSVRVLRRPRIAFLAAGSELVEAGAPLRRGQNYDANTPLARALLEEMGAAVTCGGILGDDREALGSWIDTQLPQQDLVLVSGGSSKGEEDYNTRLLAARGELLFHGVLAAPGRPMSAVVCGGRTVLLNLAGPTLASWHGLEWCVRELIRDWYGGALPRENEVEAVLEADLPAPPLSLIVRLIVRRGEDGRLLARPILGSRPAGGGRPGHPCIAQPDANAALVTRPGEPAPQKGDRVRVRLVR